MSGGGRLASLDILRAVAVVLVLFRHHYFVGPLARGGWIGVDLFFVLSGFLIAGLLVSELDGTGRIQVGRFLLRRGFKIYPSFYVFLLVSLVFYRGGWAASLTEAFFVQNYSGLTGARIWYHTWSLAVEEHFYILLPLVLLAAQRARLLTSRGLVGLSALVAVACLLLRACNLAANPVVKFATHYEATHLRIDGLFFGVLLGILHFRHAPAMAAWVRRARFILALVSAALISPPFLVPLESPWMSVVGVTGLYIGWGSVLLLFLYVVPMPEWVERTTYGREVLRIGRDSYNIYLWHAFVLEVLGPIWRPFTSGLPLVSGVRGDFMIYAVMSVLCGHMATRAIEIPMLKLRDRLVPRWSGRT